MRLSLSAAGSANRCLRGSYLHFKCNIQVSNCRQRVISSLGACSPSFPDQHTPRKPLAMAAGRGGAALVVVAVIAVAGAGAGDDGAAFASAPAHRRGQGPPVPAHARRPLRPRRLRPGPPGSLPPHRPAVLPLPPCHDPVRSWIGMGVAWRRPARWDDDGVGVRWDDDGPRCGRAGVGGAWGRGWGSAGGARWGSARR
jgi:hypothetical protein